MANNSNVSAKPSGWRYLLRRSSQGRRCAAAGKAVVNGAWGSGVGAVMECLVRSARGEGKVRPSESPFGKTYPNITPRRRLNLFQDS